MQANVHPMLQAIGRISISGTTWVSDGDYAAVLLKAGGHWCLFVDVLPGQTLEQLLILDAKGDPHDIEYVSPFMCADAVV